MQLSPMRCLMPSIARRRQQCPVLAAFCSSLVDGLARLESTLSSSVSIRWCADAMRLVRRMQCDLLAVFRSADAPVAPADCPGGGAGSDSWLEQYMQETAALLDLCNALKSAVARMHRYCMVVDFAAQVHGCRAGATATSLVAAGTVAPEETDARSSAATVRGKLSDVRAVVSEVERLGRKILSGSGGGGSVVLVTLVAKITMAVVATSVLHALTHTSPPSPFDHDVVIGGGAHQRGSTLARVAVPEQLRPWRESLSAINDRVAALPASIAERESVATAVRNMIGGKMEGSEDNVELLRTRSSELREGVEMFDCVLDQVFDEVIRGRNEMLGIFRDNALT